MIFISSSSLSFLGIAHYKSPTKSIVSFQLRWNANFTVRLKYWDMKKNFKKYPLVRKFSSLGNKDSMEGEEKFHLPHFKTHSKCSKYCFLCSILLPLSGSKLLVSEFIEKFCEWNLVEIIAAQLHACVTAYHSTWIYENGCSYYFFLLS